MNMTHIQKIQQTGDPDEANELIREGWQLLGIFQRAKESDGFPAAWALYVLGKGRSSSDPCKIVSVAELCAEEANDELLAGAVFLKAITRQADGEEYPRFIIGRPSTAA
jgi:hypothetical protein